jgi:hypothetical protein
MRGALFIKLVEDGAKETSLAENFCRNIVVLNLTRLYQVK